LILLPEGSGLCWH